VAIGRALASGPRALLLDEPFSALDRPLRGRIAEVILEFCRARAVPLLLVSHDNDDVQRMVDEQFRLVDGKIEA
jgi:ABC-type sulfate/molybdate transport systems ATPase subunit